MIEESSYWARGRISRRSALRGAAAAGSGLAALGLAGCRGSKQSAAPGANAPAAKTVLDPGKGKQGGKITIQAYGDPGGGLELIKIRNAGVHQLAGFTHDGLLELRNGTPAFDGYDIGVQPNLAQAMPEQPDPLSYVFKLRPAKFHNGRTMVSEDVKYSFETYAFAPQSAVRPDWTWLDKVEAPDPQTVVVKTKFPYADAPQSLAQRYYSAILCREHQESPDAEKKLLGSGPWLFVEYQPPVVTRFKRNPDYFRQPYPYFDEIELLGTSDPEKKVADFATRKVHMTYWFPPEQRDRVKQARPDALTWPYISGGNAIFMRTDRPPFNDKRVRQALSMAIDRKALSQATAQGEGEPDQVLSIAGVAWGFRHVKDLGPAAKYWNYDPQAAKQLLAAAGVSLPMRFDTAHWNATVIGQAFVDGVNLVQAQWRNAGIVEAKDVELTFGQAAGTIGVGNYDYLMWYPSTQPYNPDIGNNLRSLLWAPPEGIKSAPTLNLSWINNPRLSALADKQVGQFKKEERIQTFREMEDILAEEQYILKGVSSTNTWFGDPSVKNMQTPRDAYNGAIAGPKYWWFDKV